MIKPILTWPDTRLSMVSDEVDDFDFKEDFNEILSNMEDSLKSEGGVGLSAIQIGVPLQIFILSRQSFESINQPVPEWATKETLVFVNPKIIEHSKETDVSWEGCLSFPEIFLKIERPKKVKLSFLDEDRDEHTVEVEGFFSRAILHEKDHLDGTTFLKYTGRLKREMVEKKMKKRKKG